MKGLILTYLLAYGGAAVALFRPLIGLHIYVLFSIVRPQVLFSWAGDLSNMSIVVGGAMLIGWAMQGFGDWNFGRARPLMLLLAAFFGWFCLSAAFAPDSERAWAMVLERAKVILPYLVGLTVIRTPEQVRQFAWVIVLAHGYLGYEMNLSYLVDGYNRAMEGLLGDNNSFAISMCAAVGPAVFLGFASPRWWQKGLAFLCAALILHTAQLTFSRGAMLSLIITGVVVLIAMPKKPSYLAALVLVAALGVRLTGPELRARFMTTFASAEERDGSAQSRLDLWQDCLQVMQRYPLVGVGPMHFPLIAFEFGWTPGKQAHSTWLQLGAECGIPALVFLLSFYLLTAYHGLRLARGHPSTEAGVHGMYGFSGLIGFIVAAQFVSIEGLEVPYYIALVVASTLKLQSQQQEAAVPAAQTADWRERQTGFAR